MEQVKRQIKVNGVPVHGKKPEPVANVEQPKTPGQVAREAYARVISDQGYRPGGVGHQLGQAMHEDAAWRIAAEAVLAADPIRREALALVWELVDALDNRDWLTRKGLDVRPEDELIAEARALLAKAKGDAA